MSKITLHEWDSSKYLTTEEDIKEYLDAALESSDLEHFKYALSQVSKAIGMTNISRKTGIPRTTLYKMFEKNRNPEFKNIQTLLNSFGCRLAIV